MADNLKSVEQEVDDVLNNTRPPNSILASEHNSIEKGILKKAGKFNGLYFQAKKTGSGTYPTGTLSWENNAMNAGSFTIRLSKLTADLNDVGYVLGIVSVNSIVHYKDYVGRSAYYRFIGFAVDDTVPTNTFYTITLESIPGNINYTFQNTENELACLNFYINPATAAAGVNTATGDGINNTDPNNPIWTFPTADEVVDGMTHRVTTISEANQITTNQNAISALITSYSRRKAVIDIVDNTTAPPTEVLGNRYILDFTGSTNASWDGANAGDIVEFDGAVWIAETPIEGWIAYLDAQDKDALFVDDGSPEWQIRNTLDSNAIHTDVSNEFNTITEELVFNDNDRHIIESAGNSFAKRFIKNVTLKNAFNLLYRPLYDRLIENSSISGTYNIDWSLAETWLLTVSGAVSFTHSNFPPAGKTKTITLHFPIGTHIPTWVLAWKAYKTGSFDITRVNTVVLEFVKTDFIKMQISQPGT